MKPSRTLVFLWLLAVIVPVVCVGFGGSIVASATGREFLFRTSPIVFAFQFLIASAPLLVLALISSITTLRESYSDDWRRFQHAAIGGSVVTLFFWGVYYYDALFGKHHGANIGMGILMLISPFLVGLAMAFAFKLSGRKESASA